MKWLIIASKSYTINFAVLLAVLGVVQASLEVFNDYLSPKAMGLVTLGIGIAVAVLRVITTQPLRDK